MQRQEDQTDKPGRPYVLWVLIALNVLIFAWDRQGRLLAQQITFADLSLRPREVVQALQPGGDVFPLATVYTSMFLHAGPMHLIGNMMFLFVFGAGIEEAFGSAKFAFYYLAWGVAAAAAQIWVDPSSSTPMLGASGAIGGVLGAFLLLYPTSKIELYLPILAFRSYDVSAWVLLTMWFVFQIWFPQQGVANWAHVGGFLAGMVTVLIMGGRSAILGLRSETGNLEDA